MAEPITMTLSALLWEYGLKPIADSIKKEYGDKTKKLLKSSLQKVFKKLSLQPKEQEIIEAEIIEADIEVLSDQDRFLEFIQNNQNIKNILKQSSYTFNGNVYGNVIDKVESGATVSPSYHFGDVHNHPNQ
jgi:predicted nucleotide-binding protein (sugar kinase/HSP70/actin superfamily)